MELSQSQTSVPSMLSASRMYDPPGKTRAAAPLFLAGSGENTVRLGLLTLVTRTVTLPDTIQLASVVGSISGPTTLEGSGLPLGHRSMVCCCAKAEDASKRARINEDGRMQEW